MPAQGKETDSELAEKNADLSDETEGNTEIETETKRETETDRETDTKRENEAPDGTIFVSVSVKGDGAALQGGGGGKGGGGRGEGGERREVEGRHPYEQLRDDSPPPTYSSMPPEFEEALKHDKVSA